MAQTERASKSEDEVANFDLVAIADTGRNKLDSGDRENRQVGVWVRPHLGGMNLPIVGQSHPDIVG